MMIAAIILTVAATLILLGWLALLFMGQLADRQVERLKGTTERDLADLFVFVDYRKLAAVYFFGFIAVPALVWLLTGNLFFTALSLPVPILAPKLIVDFVRKRRMEKFRLQLPDALAVMASSLRAGASLMTTLENLAKEARPPLSQEFSLLLRNQRIGMSFEDALNKMEERVPLEEMGLFAAGVRISRETGGNLGEMLDSLAGTLTRTLQIEGKIRSLTSLGKIQGLVMTALPPLMIVVLSQLQPREMHPLFTTLQGYMTLGVIAVMELLGYLGIRKITNIDV
ncbi:MAG: type II secretion system F family protein [Proteobacteria bacterium]|nr:type II secretion system F family protein [Pseudomonadota bacterium]